MKKPRFKEVKSSVWNPNLLTSSKFWTPISLFNSFYPPQMPSFFCSLLEFQNPALRKSLLGCILKKQQFTLSQFFPGLYLLPRKFRFLPINHCIRLYIFKTKFEILNDFNEKNTQRLLYSEIINLREREMWVKAFLVSFNSSPSYPPQPAPASSYVRNDIAMILPVQS